jgi:lincosamide nucleotidyltransferase A/C/D/E
LRDANERRVDIHPVDFDEEGGGLQAQASGIPWRYPPEGFRGIGTVLGRRVRCLSADVQVLCHDGYELDQDDIADMRLLRDRLAIELPSRFLEM